MSHILCDALGETNVVGGTDQAPDQVVKSAARVLQIIELFDVLRREAHVSEVCQLLGFPQSSTSVLLRSMVSMGYMSYNRLTRAYLPTTKVALLGNWINAPLVGDGALLRLMRRLNEQTGQAIILAARNQTVAEYIHVVQATSPVRLYVVKGSRRSLVASGAGLALVSALPDAEIKRIAMRINSEVETPDHLVSLGALMEQVQTVRETGFALTCDLVTPGGGMLSMKLPARSGSESFAIGIGGVSEVLRARADEFVLAMREEIEVYHAADSAPSIGDDRSMTADARVPILQPAYA